MVFPDYQGEGIVNLMSSIKQAFGGKSIYSELKSSELNLKKKVVLLVLDGMGYNFLTKHPESFLYKNLKGKLTSVFPSSTTAATTALMTGLAPAQHGLTGWHLYLKEIDEIVNSLPFTSLDGKNSLKESNVRFPKIYSEKSFYEELPLDCYAIVKSNFVTSAFSQEAQRGVEFISSETFDEMLKKIQEISTQKEKFYTYSYWDEFDYITHRVGSNNQEIEKYFEETDKKIQRISKKLEGSGTTLIITADHGLIETEYIEIGACQETVECLRMPLCGEIRFAYCYVKPKKKEKFMGIMKDKFGKYLDIYESQDLLSKGFFGPGKPHGKLLERIGDFTLIMKDNYALADYFLVANRKEKFVSNHGGLSEDEMLVPLIVIQ